jgi:tRNA dimethylallyltransferase
MFEGFSKPIVICGANASGKTSISLSLALLINAEILSADSRQIYKHLQAGTSKPYGRWIKEEKRTVYLVENIPYHLVDFLDLIESYNAQKYYYDFKKTLEIVKTKNIIICGGTGLYINTIFNPLDPLPPANLSIRMQLKEFADKYGKEKLYQKLLEIDPQSAKDIHPNNIQRIIRAIEVSILTSKPYSQLITKDIFNLSRYINSFFVFIKWKKDLLYKRIKKRTKDIFKDWVEETKNVIMNGYPLDCPGLKSIGYPQIIRYINGEITEEETIESITNESLDYAKRQNTWFKRYPSFVIEINDEKDFDPQRISQIIMKKYYESTSGNNKKQE